MKTVTLAYYRRKSNGTEHVNNVLLLCHLRRLVHDERLIHRWASNAVLPLVYHALSAAPNSKLGGLSPMKIKFGTTDYRRFHLPLPLVPGNNYCNFGQQLDHSLATVRANKASKFIGSLDNQVKWRRKLVVEEFKIIELCGKLKNGMFNMWSDCCNKRSQSKCVVTRKRCTYVIYSVVYDTNPPKLKNIMNRKISIIHSIVTVRRPVPVPFPVLWLLAHKMIDQSTILYIILHVQYYLLETLTDC